MPRPRDSTLFQNRLLTRAAPIQSHDRKGVVSANAISFISGEPHFLGAGKLAFNCATWLWTVMTSPDFGKSFRYVSNCSTAAAG